MSSRDATVTSAISASRIDYRLVVRSIRGPSRNHRSGEREFEILNRLTGLVILVGCARGPPRPIPAYQETLPNGVKYTVLDSESNGPFDNVGPYKVPPDHYFMMGDNRESSCDSRSWGTVPKQNLIGKVFATYWPPNRISIQ